ncbi:hypothetical protein [Nonomuraea deserti]|nr:hypothetical protein [Nonomuraea deserti]
MPGLLVGTPEEIADKLRENHERLGFTYITVMEEGIDEMGKVIERLR